MKKYITLFVFLLPLLAWAGETDFSAAAKKIKLQNDSSVESQYGQEEWFQSMKEWLTTPQNWETAMKTIEQRIGLVSKNGIETIVTWKDELGDTPTAYGGTKDGRGTVQVAPRFLHRLPKEQWPIILQCTFAHEFTHVLQRTLAPHAAAGWPDWFREGMAIYAGGDAILRNSIMGYKPDDLVPLEQSEKRPHPRGTMVFKYMHEKYGPDKIKELVKLTILDNQSLEQGFAKATGVSWAQFKQDEQKWSLEFLQKRMKK